MAAMQRLRPIPPLRARKEVGRASRATFPVSAAGSAGPSIGIPRARDVRGRGSGAALMTPDAGTEEAIVRHLHTYEGTDTVLAMGPLGAGASSPGWAHSGMAAKSAGPGQRDRRSTTLSGT